jgi:excisionase family DNA binding protein
MSDRLITAREAAEQLNVSVRTIYSWLSSGRLPSVRLSARCTRVPVAAVEALIHASAKPGQPDLASLLWDVDPDRIDEFRDADFLIVRILTAGRPEHVSWMFRRYPRAKIERIVAVDRRLSDRVAGGWRNLLGLGEAEGREARL